MLDLDIISASTILYEFGQMVFTTPAVRVAPTISCQTRSKLSVNIFGKETVSPATARVDPELFENVNACMS